MYNIVWSTNVRKQLTIDEIIEIINSDDELVLVSDQFADTVAKLLEQSRDGITMESDDVG